MTNLTMYLDMDWALLRKQKATLVALWKSYDGHPDIQGDLDGVIHFIDAYQDSALGMFNEKDIFGPDWKP